MAKRAQQGSGEERVTAKSRPMMNLTARMPSVRQQSQGMFNVLNNVDLVPSNVQFSHQEALLFVFEDNEAVIKMIKREEVPQ